ncbi:MAG: hypothetical protein H0V76_12695 [Blastocatellia bacterium]|nr:hypothetical protein [Blastocatellia bacterium]
MDQEIDKQHLEITAAAPTLRSDTVAWVASALALGAAAAAAYQRIWGAALLAIIASAAGVFSALVARRSYANLAGSRARFEINVDSASPDIQCENLNIEVRELARVLDAQPDQQPDLRTAFIVAEDLALRQIQIEEGVSIIRHVSVGGIPFDAAFFRGGDLVCAEVSFLVSPDIRQERLDSIMRKIALLKHVIEQRSPSTRLVLMMVVITQLGGDENAMLSNNIRTKRFKTTPVDIEIRMLDFETLQSVFIKE